MPESVTNFLVIDPGITTGFVYGAVNETEIYLKPFQERFSCYELMQILLHKEPKTLIYEDFEFRRNLIHAELFPVQLIGVINCWAESVGKQFPDLVAQRAAQVFGKGAYFNDSKKLKELGIYKEQTGGEKNHMMEAMRHFAYWYTFGSGHKFYPRELKLVE